MSTSNQKSSSKRVSPRESKSEYSEGNPYATSKREESFWDSLVSSLGFTSDYDLYEADRLQAAANYEAQLLAREHNENYDSASEQLNRMKAAGLNPDLVGGVDAGESAGSGESLAPIGDIYNSVGNDQLSPVISSIVSAVGTVTGVVSSIGELSGLGIELDKAELGVNSAMADFARSFAEDMIDLESLDLDKLVGDKDVNDPSVLDAVSSKLYETYQRNMSSKGGQHVKTHLFRRKKLNDKFDKYLSDYKSASSFRSMASGILSQYNANRSGALVSSAQYSAMVEGYSEMVKVVNEVYVPTFQQEIRNQLKALNVEDKQLDVTSKGLDVEREELSLERQKIKKEKETAAYQAAQEEATRKLISALQGIIKDTDVNSIGGFAKTLLIQQAMMNINTNLVSRASGAIGAYVNRPVHTR